ncbi:MAG: phosphate ABC transporter ATP-binding protein [Alkalispirochaetaceae bacterium]
MQGSPERGLSEQGLPDKENSAVYFEDFSLYYGNFKALRSITMGIRPQSVTAFIGPSGCGKSSLLRAVNRMNDLLPSSRTEGTVYYNGVDVHDRRVDPAKLRKQVGMVFQQPNPYPTSIRDNIAWGLRLHGHKQEIPDRVEHALKQVGLWADVKDNLNRSALTLSGGQQQRLCIARTIALEPTVLIMDEPTSALDPVTSAHIEDLIIELARNYTIVIASHNLNQTARISDYTAFMMMDENKCGYLEEYGDSASLFLSSANPRLQEYIYRHYWEWDIAE